MDGMEASDTTPEQLALDRAVEIAGGKTSLMRKLNARGWAIGSHNTINRWRENGVPEKYVPDIEDITRVRSEEICPGPNWEALRGTRRATRRTAKAA
jgi:DNA-binding transcriptional regulator YdaS (Cro superfamily)